MSVVLDGNTLRIEQVEAVARGGQMAEIAPDAWERIRVCRAMVEDKIEKREVMYGVTTGIGEFSEVVLTPDQTRDFQKYLVYSHAAGCGKPLPEDVVRAAMLSRINVHCNGKSGLRPVVDETLLAMLNKGVTPMVFDRGSVGASGDLSPMSQVALVVMGKGEAFYKGERLSGAAAMKKAGIATIVFEARDGLATINGSNMITGMGSLMMNEMQRWIRLSEIAAAMSLEALNANMLAFDERLHKARGYDGAVTSAANIRRLTEGSALLKRPGKRVQDAYSLRSTPQIVGAARDTWKFAHQIFETELNGVGDNPLFFPEDDAVITGANFQGTPMAFALEFMGIAVTTVCVLSERRLNRLMNPALSAGLPGFLIERGGMFSGLMLTQYTAGALVAENRVLSTPAAIQSVPAAADQEDFVSMGWTTAVKTRQILDHAYQILGIEMMAAAQAFDLRKPAKPSAACQAAYDVIREYISFMDEDRPTYNDNNKMAELARDGSILEAVEAVTGPLA